MKLMFLGKRVVGTLKYCSLGILILQPQEKNVFQIPDVSSHGRTVYSRIVYFRPLSHSIIGNRKWPFRMMSLSEGTGHAHVNPLLLFLFKELAAHVRHSLCLCRFQQCQWWRGWICYCCCTTKQSHQNVRPPTYQ